jgi:CMP-N-acetylneuraminic acid synthetase/spore coat polysaccharide biosynthesis predicted glycosyltransferase SpsG
MSDLNNQSCQENESRKRAIEKDQEKAKKTRIAVIPARGGSKGVPRKNLRPLLGRPLISYSIRSCIDSGVFDAVVVSTDDDEIALLAERFGATVVERPSELGQDSITLDPVIEHAVRSVEGSGRCRFDYVFTVQPTSPLVAAGDLLAAMDLFDQGEHVETVLSVVDDRHLRWTHLHGKFVPEYRERLNRQYLAETYRETGAIIACKRDLLETGTRIGKTVELLPLPVERSIDIDSDLDFFICESILARKRVVFSVVGRKELGLGHAYRGLLIASEFVGHEVIFVCEESDSMAVEIIRTMNYKVKVVPVGGMLNGVIQCNPDIVINDILDTKADYIAALKQEGIAVVNFEDLGEGASQADLVINALYPLQEPSATHLIGEKYFCLRDEFIHLTKKEYKKEIRSILITFGGVDENNLTVRTLRICSSLIKSRSIHVSIIAGPGYSHTKSLQEVISEEKLEDYVDWTTSTRRISDYMLSADVAITSGGRTVLELASIGVPTIVMCQNQRETTHTFASEKNGIVNLGLHSFATDAEIRDAVEMVVDSFTTRLDMVTRMSLTDLTGGKKRVISRIFSILNERNID